MFDIEKSAKMGTVKTTTLNGNSTPKVMLCFYILALFEFTDSSIELVIPGVIFMQQV